MGERILLNGESIETVANLGVNRTFLSNFGSNSGQQFRTVASRIAKVRGRNRSGTLYYLQVHDLATAPVGGETPLISFPVGVGASSSPTIDERPSAGDIGFFQCANGVWAGWSSTDATYTAAAPALAAIEVELV